jgi:2-polyprenyl-6-methoxyphenol hydroxylase-like FAD-dependent oxidoreductase
MYDVIVIGARVAGASTALLLARKGLRVLCVDRAAFPSDTLSSHQVQVPGAAALQRWRLLDRVIASGTPPTRRIRFDYGDGVIEGCFPKFESVDALYSPRRLILDKLLVDAARESGAEVRERFAVEEIVFADGKVSGIRGKQAGSASTVEKARFVVGADGKQSILARAVAAPLYRNRGVLTTAYYAYWSGLKTDGGETYARHRRAIGVWPTHDGLTVTFLAAPIDEAPAFKAEVEAQCMKTFDMAGDLGNRIREAKRVGSFRGTSDLPNFFRKPHGPNWALVGDAGLVMDPVTGHGISLAFRHSELLSDSLSSAFEGRQSLATSLADYERRRNLHAVPLYKLTMDAASLHSIKPEQKVFFEAIREKPEEVAHFFGLLTGSVPYAEFRSARHLLGLLGLAGVGRALAARIGLK